jgi:heme-degrading monooxygenase HmoA
MIARIWHGRTKVKNYEDYTEFMRKKALPDYRETEGFIKLIFLRSIIKNVGHFKLITFWENFEVIKNFAGEDFEKAKYYPEDKKFLLEFEEKVIHYEVFAELG